MAKYIYIRAYDLDAGLASTSYLYAPEGSTIGLAHQTIEFTPGSNDVDALDVSRIVVQGARPSEKDVAVLFERRCVPDNPFYIRWINRQGGFEYQMFDQHKAYANAVSGFVDYAPAIPDTTAATRTREILNITDAKRTVTAGLEQLDRNEYERLVGVMYSPRIDAWNVELQRWEGVTLDGNMTSAWDTHGTRAAIEFTFRMIDVSTQF